MKGIFTGDLHFSLKPPGIRSVEPNWLGVQEGYVNQLRSIQCDHSANGVKPPVFIAGDVFDSWDSPAELISHVISWLRRLEDVYAIPGNHDLPGHNLKEVCRSAYWTLGEAGVLHHLSSGFRRSVNDLEIYPYSYGCEVQPKPPETVGELCTSVALVHGYVWVEGMGHQKADEGARYASWMAKLKGYDAAFFGDNHQGFLMAHKPGQCSVMNTGTFMRRHSDEKDYRPRVGLLYADGSVGQKFLDVSQDKFADPKEQPTKIEASLEMDLAEFARELQNVHARKQNYVNLVMRWLEADRTPEEIKSLMLAMLGVRK